MRIARSIYEETDYLSMKDGRSLLKQTSLEEIDMFHCQFRILRMSVAESVARVVPAHVEEEMRGLLDDCDAIQHSLAELE